MSRQSTNELRRASTNHHVALHVTILLLCAAVLILARLSELNGTDLYLLGFKSPHRCPLYYTFGIKCALCGLTRSLVSFAHGNLARSFRSHALGPPIFAFTCLQIPYRIWALTAHPKRLNKIAVRVNLSLAIMLAVAILVNWCIYLGGLIL